MTLDHRLYVTVQARLMKGQVMDGLKALTINRDDFDACGFTDQDADDLDLIAKVVRREITKRRQQKDAGLKTWQDANPRRLTGENRP